MIEQLLKEIFKNEKTGYEPRRPMKLLCWLFGCEYLSHNFWVKYVEDVNESGFFITQDKCIRCGEIVRHWNHESAFEVRDEA